VGTFRRTLAARLDDAKINSDADQVRTAAPVITLEDGEDL